MPRSDVSIIQTRNYDFNYLDRLISGAEENLTQALRYWRTRFILIPSDRPPVASQSSAGEAFSDQEIHITGATRLLETINRYRWKRPGDTSNTTPLKLLPTWLAPSACVTDALLMQDLENLHQTGDDIKTPGKQAEILETSLTEIAADMRDSANGLPIDDRWWHKAFYPDSFQGDNFVTWLIAFYADVKTRDAGAEWGRKLMEQGLIGRLPTFSYWCEAIADMTSALKNIVSGIMAFLTGMQGSSDLHIGCTALIVLISLSDTTFIVLHQSICKASAKGKAWDGLRPPNLQLQARCQIAVYPSLMD
jgi:hypothetical protein